MQNMFDSHHYVCHFKPFWEVLVGLLKKRPPLAVIMRGCTVTTVVMYLNQNQWSRKF